MAGVEEMDFIKHYPSKEFQLDWIKSYLTEFDGVEPTESRLMLFYDNVNKFSICYLLMWGLWGLVQSQISKIDFDYFVILIYTTVIPRFRPSVRPRPPSGQS